MTHPALPELIAAIGAAYVLTDPADMAPALREGRGRYQGEALAVLRPGSTQEVSDCVKICVAHGLTITPQGGNTGLVGGGVPQGGVVISTARLKAIRSIDALNSTLTVEAGATLAEVQAAAASVDRLFPLSLASEGSCTIGGNLSSNAGGTAVLRYGNTRDLTLGIEAVLPDGRILNVLSALRKDNTGYDLKNLLIGAEGTLGIITACVLKLFPAPRQRATAFAGLQTPEAALACFDILRARAGESLTGFEYLERFGIEIVTRHMPGSRDPLAEVHPAYALIELTSSDPEADLNARLETALGEAIEAGFVDDAVVASSEAQRSALWALREYMSEMQKHEGASIKHDVAVPVSRVAEFITRGKELCSEMLPGLRPCPFGHLGDGNIHFNLTRPLTMTDADFLAMYDAFNLAVHDLVHEMQGSISAEHGIGLAKRDELPRYKDPVALDLCKTLKAALDPANLMNPGKML